MKILLSNDDGYQAPGINVLADHLVSCGHEVIVIAPSGQRSAQSHAMSFYNAVQVNKMRDNLYSVNGTPADCVAIALGAILKETPVDLVVAGINHGLNVGIDVNYSGTVGAATEAALIGYKAIAVSADTNGLDENEQVELFKKAADLTAQVIGKLDLIEWPKLQVLNINVPTASKGVKLAQCGGESLYIPFIEELSSERQKHLKVYMLGGSDRFAPDDLSQDVSLVSSGFSTLSFIQAKQSSSDVELLSPILEHLK